MSAIIREFTLQNLKKFRQMHDNKIANSYVKGNTTGNDYAEYFPKIKDDITEPGDIIVLDMSVKNESYTKSTSETDIVVGVHSDEYASVIGGVIINEDMSIKEAEEYNKTHFIPIALAGRVHVKFYGKAIKGKYVVPSNIPGYGIMSDSPINSVGMIIETDDRTEFRKIKIKVK